MIEVIPVGNRRQALQQHAASRLITFGAGCAGPAKASPVQRVSTRCVSFCQERSRRKTSCRQKRSRRSGLFVLIRNVEGVRIRTSRCREYLECPNPSVAPSQGAFRICCFNPKSLKKKRGSYWRRREDLMTKCSKGWNRSKRKAELLKAGRSKEFSARRLRRAHVCLGAAA